MRWRNERRKTGDSTFCALAGLSKVVNFRFYEDAQYFNQHGPVPATVLRDNEKAGDVWQVNEIKWQEIIYRLQFVIL